MRRTGATRDVPSSSDDAPTRTDDVAPTATTETTTTTVEELPSGELVSTTSLGGGDTPLTPSTPTSRAATPAPSPASLAVDRGETLTPVRFELLQLGVDRRLLLNRKRQIKMFRVWMQGRWRKPAGDAASGGEGAGAASATAQR